MGHEPALTGKERPGQPLGRHQPEPRQRSSNRSLSLQMGTEITRTVGLQQDPQRSPRHRAPYGAPLQRRRAQSEALRQQIRGSGFYQSASNISTVTPAT